MSGYIGVQPVPQATQTRQSFTATANQTSFGTLGYQVDYLSVYLNGVKLNSADFTATNGSDIVLGSGCAVNDILEMVAFSAFTVANQTFTGTTTVNTLAVTGNVDGRDVSVDGTKLDGIEASATADQTNAEIKTAVQAGSDIALGGNPTTTTQSAGNNTTRIATTAFTQAAVTALVDSSPDAMNTLNELAAALGDDASFSTTVTNSIATKLPLAGGAVTGNVTFGDNNKAIFGAGSDLQIYHDGTRSYVDDAGAGSLWLRGGDVAIKSTASETMAEFANNGAVTLYHDNVATFATNSSGIELGANDGTSILRAGGANTHLTLGAMGSAGTIKFGAGASNGTIGGTKMTLASTGLNITGNVIAKGYFASEATNSTNKWLTYTHTDNTLRFNYNGAGADEIVITSGGDVLFRTTSVIDAASGTQDGFSFSAGNRADFSRLNNPVLDLRRRGNDGSVLDFYKDTANVGSIATRDGFLVVHNGDTGLGFDAGGDHIRPMSSSGSRNAAIDLGRDATRFRDLYLSGGVTFDTNGEFLNDYELGTWTASPTTGSCTSNTWYIKVGKSVTVAGNIYGFSNRSSSATVIIGTLPFAVASGKSSTGAIIGRYIDNPGYAVYTDGGGTTLTFYNNPSDAAYETMKHADFNNSGADIHFSVTYLAAS